MPNTFRFWLRIGRLLGLEPRRKPSHNRGEDLAAQLEASRLLMRASARTDLPAFCVRNVGEALIALARTLPDPTEEEEDVP